MDPGNSLAAATAWSRQAALEAALFDQLRARARGYWPAAAPETLVPRSEGFVERKWSFVARVSIGREMVYVKTPKAAPSQWQLAAVSDPLARRTALRECSSLRDIAAVVSAAAVSAVRPVPVLDYLEDFNALLTEGRPGRPLDALCREARTAAELARALGWLRQLGGWLRAFHKQARRQPLVTWQRERPIAHAFADLQAQLRARGADSPPAHRAIERLAAHVGTPPGNCHTIVDGFELMNVLAGDQGLYLLDTGELRRGSRWEDVGRLLASVRLLYWGSPRQLRRRSARDALCHAFLAGYGVAPAELPLALAYAGKWLLRRWLDASVALDGARPAGLRGAPAGIARRLYIEQVFQREIERVGELTRHERA